jgi:leucyl aminopeptidase
MTLAPALVPLQVNCVACPPPAGAADLVVVPVFEGERPDDLVALGSGGEAFVDAGPRSRLDAVRARRLGVSAGLRGRERAARRLCIVARHLQSDPGFMQALAEGLVLAQFDAGQYKTRPRLPRLDTVDVLVDAPDARFERAMHRGTTIARYCNIARELVNEPPNFLTPRALGDRAAQLGREAGVRVEVVEEEEIRRLNLRLLLGVARGSVEPARLIVLRHDGTDAPGAPLMGFIGKGVTFDAGGLCARRPDDLDLMKYDMAGGAAVIGAVCALGALGTRVRCIGIVPATENLPGGTAIRPGDVLVSAAGRTVEVVDPDAEGRLILADALWYARSLGATHLVDLATLTSGCIAALGESASGLLGAPDSWIARVEQAAEDAGEPVCRLPLPAERPQALESTIADLANRARVPGSTVVAAAFLREFVGSTPWAHLDVAGTAWTDVSTAYQQAGPTGTGVRTLIELAGALATN